MLSKLALPAFALMVLVQLYVPARMIFQKEKVIMEGKEFKFRTAPIDPNDPFRGKYITLSFNETAVKVQDSVDWYSGDPVYVYLTTDSAGYAIIQSVTKDKPGELDDYINATVSYVISDTVSTVFVSYPFDRFYMEESKAPAAEQIYNEAAIDTNQVAYALVMVRNGEAVVRDVMIDGVSILDIIEKQQKNPQ
jgi:uncharacterized membrane-anchored protein